MTTYFASLPRDQDSIVALVTREAAEECRDDRLPPLVLDHCVRESVASLRGSRITTFVPLLALRRVRACIRAGTCDCDEW
jgi:hypothetical protein